MGLDLEDKKAPGISGSEERVLQAAWTASAKVLRQEQAWHIEGMSEGVSVLVR